MIDFRRVKGGADGLEEELLEVHGVSDELLKVHGVPPGSKPDSVIRLIYENLNGLNSRINRNEKLKKARGVINDLGMDVVCCNEHRVKLSHKYDKNQFLQMFRGGEANICSVAAHNRLTVKEARRVHKGGTAMLLFGSMIEQYNFEASGRDELGLGRWVTMAFRGDSGIMTRVVCGYNPCHNKEETRTNILPTTPQILY